MYTPGSTRSFSIILHLTLYLLRRRRREHPRYQPRGQGLHGDHQGKNRNRDFPFIEKKDFPHIFGIIFLTQTLTKIGKLV